MIYLLLVLPFPPAFILHELEELMVQHRWMAAHRTSLIEGFPSMRSLIGRLSTLGTRAFSIAALEELVLLLLATAWMLVQGPLALQIWSALFMAFSFHLLVHIGVALVLRSYVPGLATSVLLLPFAAYGVWSIWLVMSAWEMVLWAVSGIVFMWFNLYVAHYAGRRFS